MPLLSLFGNTQHYSNKRCKPILSISMDELGRGLNIRHLFFTCISGISALFRGLCQKIDLAGANPSRSIQRRMICYFREKGSAP